MASRTMISGSRQSPLNTGGSLNPDAAVFTPFTITPACATNGLPNSDFQTNQPGNLEISHININWLRHKIHNIQSLSNLTMTSRIGPSRTLNPLAPIFTPRQPLGITHRDSAHDLVISQLNCQGFLKKMDVIFNFMITDWKSDILCLSETWLRPSSTVDTPFTGKFHSFTSRSPFSIPWWTSCLRTQSRTSTPSS